MPGFLLYDLLHVCTQVGSITTYQCDTQPGRREKRKTKRFRGTLGALLYRLEYPAYPL
jgi:hypothetical protein